MRLASTRTIASSAASSSGSATSSIRTSPGAWKVTARMPRAYERIASRREERSDGDRQVAAGADHGLLDGDRKGDGRAAGRRRLERARDGAATRRYRGPRHGRLQDG